MSSGAALQNHLLGLLPRDEYLHIKDKLEPVSLRLGQVIYEFDDRLTHVYYPTTAIVSFLFVMENGSTAEIGLAGNNGLVGVVLFMGGDSSVARVLVQIAGDAVRMEAGEAKKHFARGGAFQSVMLRYAQSLLCQISQTAVCNRLHTIEQQLCRWLLLNHDQVPDDRLTMTHELIANMLGVRREGVSVAAARLQADGIIKYSRGTITILDRKRLEDAACECYRVVMHEYERLLGPYIPAKR